MKKILFIILLSVPLFAQYGNELVFNGSFDSDATGWRNVTFDTWQWSSGKVNAIHLGGGWKLFGVDDAGTGGVDKRFNITNGITYRFDFDVTINSGNATIAAFWRSATSGSQLKSWGFFSAGSKSSEWESNVTSACAISFDINFACNFDIDNVSVRQKLDTLYISAAGSDAALGDADNPIATIAEALARGFYDGGVFAFRSGDTFDETFTAGNNTTLAVYGGSSTVTISTIDANGYTVTQSALINPVTDKKTGYGGFNGFIKY